MATGKIFTELDDLLEEVEGLVYENKTFAVTADHVQEALKDIAKSTWIDFDYLSKDISKITGTNLQGLYCGGKGFPWPEGIEPMYYDSVVNTIGLLDINTSKTINQLNIHEIDDGISGTLNLMQSFTDDGTTRTYNNIISPNIEASHENLEFLLPRKSGVLALEDELGITIENSYAINQQKYYYIPLATETGITDSLNISDLLKLKKSGSARAGILKLEIGGLQNDSVFTNYGNSVEIKIFNDDSMSAEYGEQWTNIVSTNVKGQYTLYLPNKGGTIAVTDDVEEVVEEVVEEKIEDAIDKAFYNNKTGSEIGGIFTFILVNSTAESYTVPDGWRLAYSDAAKEWENSFNSSFTSNYKLKLLERDI